MAVNPSPCLQPCFCKGFLIFFDLDSDNGRILLLLKFWAACSQSSSSSKDFTVTNGWYITMVGIYNLSCLPLSQVMFPENVNILSFLSICLIQGCDFVLSPIIFQEIPSAMLAA